MEKECLQCGKKLSFSKMYSYKKYCSRKCMQRASSRRPGRKYKDYRNGAKRRNLIFCLSNQDMKKFYNTKCFYCGSEIIEIGIDRKNNSLGYTLDNCVPCCKICNRMKMTMNSDEFIKHCHKINKFSVGI